MNPLRNRRQAEVRIRLHTKNLDIGAGEYPITKSSITLDTREDTHPDYVADITKRLPFPDNTFDSITACEVLEHFSKLSLQQHILKEIYRIIKHGGQFLMTIPNASTSMIIPQRIVWFIRERTDCAEHYYHTEIGGHIGMHTPKLMQSMVEHAGFTIKESRRLMLYDYIIVATK